VQIHGPTHQSKFAVSLPVTFSMVNAKEFSSPFPATFTDPIVTCNDFFSQFNKIGLHRSKTSIFIFCVPSIVPHLGFFLGIQSCPVGNTTQPSDIF
jgi:hypothetical protein